MELILFGIIKEWVTETDIDLQENNIQTVKDLKLYLLNKYPQLNSLSSYMIAVNQTYAEDNMVLSTDAEVAILPPVSGG